MSSTPYTFTTDWVSTKTDIWRSVFAQVEDKKSFLEVGSYEGRSAVWFIENAIEENGSITCIDNWSWDLGTVKQTFDNNIQNAQLNNPTKSISVLTGDSYKELATLLHNGRNFNVIYIDGAHKTKDVIIDACICWCLLKRNGIMIFDDYLYKFRDADIDQDVKLAVDSFCNLFKGYFEYLYVGQQVIIRKLI